MSDDQPTDDVDAETGSAEQPGKTSSTQDPAETLTSVFSPGWLVWIAVTCLLVAIILMCLAMFWPAQFARPISREICCVAIALLASIFLFVLYPQKIQSEAPSYFGGVVEITGPAALLGVLLWAMLQIVPLSPTGRMCIANYGAGQPRPWRTIGVEPVTLDYRILVDPTDKSFRGLYVDLSATGKQAVTIFLVEATDKKVTFDVTRGYAPLPFDVPHR